MSLPPGLIRDAVTGYLASLAGEATLTEITAAVAARLGDVSPSSVRSYLNLNVPETFLRVGRGRYRLAGPDGTVSAPRLRDWMTRPGLRATLGERRKDRPEGGYSAGSARAL